MHEWFTRSKASSSFLSCSRRRRGARGGGVGPSGDFLQKQGEGRQGKAERGEAEVRQRAPGPVPAAQEAHLEELAAQHGGHDAGRGAGRLDEPQVLRAGVLGGAAVAVAAAAAAVDLYMHEGVREEKEKHAGKMHAE